MAKLYFRYGAMNSGKSTILMQVDYNYMERGMKAIVIKPKIDTKAGDKVSARIGLERKADFLIDENMNIFEKIKEHIRENGEIHCVIVDEVQFISKKVQVDQLLEVAVKLDVPVICYGLRTDFMMQGFPASERLLLLAHTIEEMKTICRCGKKATFNGRKINGEFVFEGEQIVIDDGVEVEYESLCPECYYAYKEGRLPDFKKNKIENIA